MLSGMNADFIIIGVGMVGLSAHRRIAAPDFRHPDSGWRRCGLSRGTREFPTSLAAI